MNEYLTKLIRALQITILAPLMRFLLTTILIIFSTNLKAEIISEPMDEIDVIFINGEIEKGDMQKFASLPIEWTQTIVLLNSDGGSAADAITMSAFLATKGAITYILPGHQCLSECALIWLAGDRKMLSNSSKVGFGNSSYELTNAEKKIIGPMILGEDFDHEISGLGFVAAGQLLQMGLDFDFDFVSEFLTYSDANPRYLSQRDFDKYDIEVLFENDEDYSFRDALRDIGISPDKRVVIDPKLTEFRFRNSIPKARPNSINSHCKHFTVALNKQKFAISNIIRKKGWEILAEEQLAQYKFIAFAGKFETGTSSTCSISESNIAIFKNDGFSGILYPDSSRDTLIGNLKLMDAGFINVFSGSNRQALVAELRLTPEGLELTPPSSGFTAHCNGKSIVPNTLGYNIADGREVMFEFGFKPIPHEQMSESWTNEYFSEITELTGCSNGITSCFFEYENDHSRVVLSTPGNNKIVKDHVQCKSVYEPSSNINYFESIGGFVDFVKNYWANSPVKAVDEDFKGCGASAERLTEIKLINLYKLLSTSGEYYDDDNDLNFIRAPSSFSFLGYSEPGQSSYANMVSFYEKYKSTFDPFLPFAKVLDTDNGIKSYVSSMLEDYEKGVPSRLDGYDNCETFKVTQGDFFRYTYFRKSGFWKRRELDGTTDQTVEILRKLQKMFTD